MIASVSSDKYHINTMEIIKLFWVNISMPVTKFPFLAFFYFAKESPFGSLISLEDISNKITTKIGNFALRKKGRKKTNNWGSEILPSSNMDTKKHDQKERARLNF